MKPKDLRIKSLSDLENLLEEKRKELLKLRMDMATKKIKDVSLIKKTKRDIARILTIINEKKFLFNKK